MSSSPYRDHAIITARETYYGKRANSNSLALKTRAYHPKENIVRKMKPAKGCQTEVPQDESPAENH